MAETELYTFQDAVDHIADAFSAAKNNEQLRKMKRAVLNAYRRLPDMHQWSYFQHYRPITTSPAISDGTLAYDHVGGAHARMVTFSGADDLTDDIRHFNLLIDQTIYRVEDVKSTTILTLAQDSNPGADVAAGTAYTLYRSHYPLPIGFRKAGPLTERGRSTDRPSYLPPQDLLAMEAFRYQPQTPDWYTFRNAGEHYGGMCIEFSPPPLEARTYEMMCDVSPRALRTYKFATGTATITASSTTLTLSGAGAEFNSLTHPGAIVRLTKSTTTEPTGLAGDDTADNPFRHQRVIMSVDSSTTATLDAVTGEALTGVKYTISDPLDLEFTSMGNLFWRLCESEYQKIARFKKEEWLVSEADLRRELIEAIGADNRSRDLQAMMPGVQSGRLGALARPEAYADSTPI